MHPKKIISLSFSGAGHLLPYHLGVARVFSRFLKKKQKQPKHANQTLSIESVSGSSSGAIAAAVMAFLSHRLEEYTDIFISEGGNALTTLDRMLQEKSIPYETRQHRQNQNDSTLFLLQPPSITLLVATTKCEDGSLHLFPFESSVHEEVNNTSNVTDFHNPKTFYDTSIDDYKFSQIGINKHHLMRTIKASCYIPLSFHPIDIFTKATQLSYPKHEGIEIDGTHYVDGAIASPAPPTTDRTLPPSTASNIIVVSPISGSIHPMNSPSSSEMIHRISPTDNTLSFLPMNMELTARCGTFRIRPSVQNIRSCFASVGFGASPPMLRNWYNRGFDDATRFLESFEC
mmetsp:Transcript_14334/g.20464  ORF Transcript_14334/g.20464 Transcript_14334/m.20464 type:complete len:344 (-) Transcript_14334:111-1142(-)